MVTLRYIDRPCAFSASIADLLLSDQFGCKISISGWVKTRRDSKEVSFIELNDGSCFAGLQVVFTTKLENYKETLEKAVTGAALRVNGTLVESPAKGQKVELQASEVDILGTADPKSYPLQKKRHSNEFLRTIAHLRTRTNTFSAVFRLRNQAAFAIHKFFQQRRFLWLHSPIITTSDCEGAGQMFQVTTLDLEKCLESSEKSLDYNKDFFGTKANLTVSGQLEGEAFACSLGRIYTFGPTFRAENSNTPRHLAEFWMVEPEMAFCDLEGNMQLAQEFIKFIVNYVLEHSAEDMQFFDRWIEKGILNSLKQLVSASFAHLTYTEAIEVLEKSARKFEYPVSWGMDLQTEHERYLTEEYVKGPVFVTNYPKDIKAFYMRLDDNDKTVSAMDLLVPRLGEIIGGSQREEREDILNQRMRESGIQSEEFDWYQDLRRFGSNPHAGFGLGFERLIMYLSGMQNIRDVIPFPRTPGNARF